MINLEEIKSLPAAEKLQLIDELWQTMDEDIQVLSEEEEEKIITTRLAHYEKGEVKFHPWEEVKVRIQQQLREV